jgi:type I restriction enzyme M protein
MLRNKKWEMMDDNYLPAIPEGLRWRDWADDEEGITGDALLDFVNNTLFKGLKEMGLDESSPRVSFLVREVFSDSYNYMKSGTLIRQVINKLNDIDFKTQKDRHQFNDIYETILRDLQSAGNAGEFYTPRPVTQFIVDMINPQLGEKVLDPACGTGGFLISTLENLKEQTKSIDDVRILQDSVLGTEKKSLPYLLSVTNMILHGIDVPKIRHDNSLSRNVRDYTPAEKVDMVVTNPPFGGIEEDGITINFPTQFRTKETADLFMVLLMYILKGNGRAGIVLPDGFLFGEGIKTRIKEKLLDEFNLHTIVRLPNGVFAPYTDIKTNLLFLSKGDSTKEVWYYEHQLPEGYKKYTKTKPIRHEEFDVIKEWWNKREENEYAWKVSAEDIKEKNYNLDLKNPIKMKKFYESPEELLAKYYQAKDEVQKVRDLLKEQLKEVIERG